MTTTEPQSSGATASDVTAANDRIAFEVATWNVQGSKEGRSDNSSIWTDVKHRMESDGRTGRGRLALLNMQEAGPRPPATANQTNRPPIVNGNATLTEHVWNAGTESRSRIMYVYFLNINEGSRRLNLATVVGGQAQQMFIRHPQGGKRPAMGLYFEDTGTTWWNAHIVSGGGTRTINEANQYASALRTGAGVAGQNWVIMADWNIEPETIQQSVEQNGARLIAPISDRSTHNGGKVLDYAIVGNGGQNAIQSGGIAGDLNSDHTPVRFVVVHTPANS